MTIRKEMSTSEAAITTDIAFIYSEGGVSGTVDDIKIILQYAIKSNASSIIVAHNHPSGNKEPSEADIQTTRKIREAVYYLNLTLLDHLILIPEEEYYSMADNGIIQ